MVTRTSIEIERQLSQLSGEIRELQAKATHELDARDRAATAADEAKHERLAAGFLRQAKRKVAEMERLVKRL